MGLLKNIFKKKPGGTFVGNLIRGVASKVTGGISDLVLKAPSGAVDPQQAQVVENVATPIAQQVNKTVIPVLNAELGNPNGTVQDVATSIVESSTKTAMQTVKEQLKKYWWILLIPGGLLLWWIVKKLRHHKSSRRTVRRY